MCKHLEHLIVIINTHKCEKKEKEEHRTAEVQVRKQQIYQSQLWLQKSQIRSKHINGSAKYVSPKQSVLKL